MSSVSSDASGGVLHVVATPIGNLEDLSPRAARVLGEADVVACEDTRRTGRLMQHLGLENRLISLHEHNEARRVPGLVERLLEGRQIALVSDAGTPLLADPGFVLVRAAVAAGIRVEAVPGPSAALSALAISALPPYPFTFAGFAPRKAGKRKRFLEELAPLGHTVVLFESPHRILATLEAAAEIFGERPAALCRELTKLHEETLRGTASELHAELAARDSIKGEFVLVVGPPATGRRAEDS